MMTGFTRITDFFRFDPITDLCTAMEADRGSLADFSAALYQTVKILYDDAVPNRKDPL